MTPSEPREVGGVVRVRVVSSDTVFAKSLARALTGDELAADSTTLDGLLSRSGDEVDVAVVDLQGRKGLTIEAVVPVRAHIRGPVVALTSDAGEGSVIAPLAAGVRGITLRISGAEVVRNAIQAVRAGGIYIDPAVGATLVALAAPTGRTDASDLTRTELRVLRRFPLGMTNAQIAADMGVTTNTIKTHVRSILAKLECDGKRQAVQAARARGLLQ